MQFRMSVEIRFETATLRGEANFKSIKFSFLNGFRLYLHYPQPVNYVDKAK